MDKPFTSKWNQQLNLCNACESHAAIKTIGNWSNEEIEYYKITCRGCDECTDRHYSHDAAIRQWNTKHKKIKAMTE